MIVKGVSNSGKFTIVKKAFPNIILLDSSNLYTLSELVYSIKFHSYVCIRRLDSLKFELQIFIANILDRYPHKFTLISTCTSLNICPKLFSICINIFIKPPNLQSVLNYINNAEDLNIVLDTTLPFNTIHDILLSCDLFLLKCINNPITAWKTFLHDHLIRIKTISISALRKMLYILYSQNILMKDFISETLHFICNSKYSYNIKHFTILKAAECEHNMCLGNKHLFHAELFLFSLKYKICYN